MPPTDPPPYCISTVQWLTAETNPIFLKLLRLSDLLHSIWLSAHKKNSFDFRNLGREDTLKRWKERWLGKGLSPDEIANLLREISEN
ncbi:hypothetical protein TNCV_671411 [Trichonephila clavipes]|nr:hypothetical protein TNCV_671411 [Trichonephila clavipes]